MAKTITDIIPPSRRRQMEINGETVPVSSPASYAPPTPQQSYQAPVPPPPLSANPPVPPPMPPRPLSDDPFEPVRPSGKRPFPWGIALVALLIVIGSGVVLYAFADAKVTVTPVAKSTSVSGDFTATFNSGDLPYQIVTVEKTVSANVPAESTETVNDPAQGTITITNTQETPQTLIKNTRFESPDGKIFRIQDSVSVPAGSASSPGSKEATVYADTGGDAYNIAPTSFTVPGLKGSASYDKVTATSKAAFSGGFSGTRASVAQSTRDAQNEKSKAALDDALEEEVAKELGAGYIVIPGATTITYTPASDTVGKDNTVNVNLRGTATAVALSNAGLAKAIAFKVLGSYAGQPVHLENVSALTLTPTTPGEVTAEQGTYSFSLNGTATVVYDIDATKIAGAVAGKSRSAAYSIIQSFPEVSRAVLNVRPFWKGSFPSDPTDITIATTTPSE